MRYLALAVLAAAALSGCAGQQEAAAPPTTTTPGEPFLPAYMEQITNPAPPTPQPETWEDLLLVPGVTR